MLQIRGSGDAECVEVGLKFKRQLKQSEVDENKCVRLSFCCYYAPVS